MLSHCLCVVLSVFDKLKGFQENCCELEHFLLPTDVHNVKKSRVIKTF